MATKSQISSIDDVKQDATTDTVVETAPVGKDFSGVMELLTIHASSEDGGDKAVFLQVNNSPYLLPRDVPCRVPTELVEGLRNLKVRNYTYDKEGAPIERVMPRYSFSSQPA